MKALRQLGFLKLSLRPETPVEEDHRVLALFRNRAELKKAYGDLQEEIYRLQDLVKQQEGATHRAHDMLSTLEGKLGANESAYPALVFYQLRRMWQSGRELITAFVADLSRQQEERERRSHLAAHNRRLFARRQTADKQLSDAQGLAAAANEQVAALEAERAKLTRLWHYFKRRALDQRLGAARAAATAAASTLTEAQRAVEEFANESAPEFPGLTLNARRAINLAAIAYAEVLCLRLASIKTPLVQMAREAIGQREASDAYGTPRECVLLMAQIGRAQRLLAERESLSEEIRARTGRLNRVARYRGNADTAPVADTLDPGAEGDVLQGAALGSQVAAKLPNVLAEDTWDLFRILLR
jgi:hypothetical protein